MAYTPAAEPEPPYLALPMYPELLTSMSTQADTIRAGGLVIVPGDLSVNASKQILSGGVVTCSVLVSMGVTVVGTLLSRTVSVLAAYGPSRPRSFLHRTILLIVLITTFFGAGLVPTYLLVSSFGLVDSYWALILPGAVSALNVLILPNFFMGIGAVKG